MTMVRRFGLARALVNVPRLLALGGPAVGLHPISRPRKWRQSAWA